MKRPRQRPHVARSFGCGSALMMNCVLSQRGHRRSNGFTSAFPVEVASCHARTGPFSAWLRRLRNLLSALEGFPGRAWPSVCKSLPAAFARSFATGRRGSRSHSALVVGKRRHRWPAVTSSVRGGYEKARLVKPGQSKTSDNSEGAGSEAAPTNIGRVSDGYFKQEKPPRRGHPVPAGLNA